MSSRPSFLVQRLLAVVMLLTAFSSLLFPYMHFESVAFPGKTHFTVYGWEFRVSFLTLILVTVCSLLLFGRIRLAAIAACIAALLACSSLYVVWSLLLFYGIFCDDCIAVEGYGFFLLVSPTIALFILSVIAVIRTPRKERGKTQELLDELPD